MGTIHFEDNPPFEVKLAKPGSAYAVDSTVWLTLPVVELGPERRVQQIQVQMGSGAARVLRTALNLRRALQISMPGKCRGRGVGVGRWTMLFQHLFAAGIMTVLLWIAIVLGLAALSKKPQPCWPHFAFSPSRSGQRVT